MAVHKAGKVKRVAFHRNLVVLALLASSMLAAPEAYADCTGPAALEGTIIYNTTYKIIQFCDGTKWVNAASNSTGGGGAAIGTLTAGDFCTTDGTVINCNLPLISLTTMANGTLQAAQFPALSGDISTSAGSLVTTIGAGKVTNAMLAGSIALSKLAAIGTAGATTYLRGDGTWATAGATPGGSAWQLQYNSGGSALGGASALTYATSGALLTTAAQAATDTPLVVKAAASQSSDLLQVQNSIGTTMAKIDAAGSVYTPLVKLVGVSGGPGIGTGIVGGSSGAIQFNNAGSFAGDNALFWDNTYKRLGVGTTSPSTLLTVRNTTAAQRTATFNSTTSEGTWITFESSGTAFGDIGTAVSGQSLTDLGVTSRTGNLILGTNSTERMRIASTGNVGIGTTSPMTKLDMVGASGWRFMNDTTNQQGATAWWNGTYTFFNSYKWSSPAGYQPLYVDGSVLALNSISGGNVGIGTNNPGQALTVYASSASAYMMALNDSRGDGAAGAGTVLFQRQGSQVGAILTSTTSTSYNTGSDRRIKDHIVPTARGLDIVTKIPVRDFDFRADPKAHVQGLIAQEVMPLYPEAVSTNGDDGNVPLRSTKSIWTIDYGRLTPLLIKAVQELKASNDSQAAALKAANDNTATLRREFEAYRAAHP